MTRWERPQAGLEPAATALLGWLADPQAPALCLVSGSAGCGKSMLLAWLVRHGSRRGHRQNARSMPWSHIRAWVSVPWRG